MGRFLGIIPMPALGKVTESRLFKKMALKSFEECDKDANGRLDEKELHICLLLLNDKLNDKLPCHLRPPRAEEVADLFKRHDADGEGALDESEFMALAGELFASDKHWWNSVVVKVVATAAIQLALFPLAGRGLSELFKRTEVPVLKKAAPAVWAYGIEKSYKMVRVQIPELP